MSIRGLLKLIFAATLLFTGVQFAKVYVHRTQLKKVMGDEALDARRSPGITADTVRTQVKDRLHYENYAVPEFIDFQVSGLGDPKADVVVTARYREMVDLLVYKHIMDMAVSAAAEAPGK